MDIDITPHGIFIYIYIYIYTYIYIRIYIYISDLGKRHQLQNASGFDDINQLLYRSDKTICAREREREQKDRGAFTREIKSLSRSPETHDMN